MSENKSDSQTTELEGLNAYGKTLTLLVLDKGKPKSDKGQRSGKAKRTKKVVVKMPTVNRRLDDEHKLFPRGIEGIKGTLEQIKEESKDKLTDEVVLNVNSEHENKENVNELKDIAIAQRSDNNTDNDKKKNDVSDEANNSASQHLYGMFTRTNTERSLLSNRSNSISIILPVKRKPSCSSIKRPKSTGGWTKKEIDLFLPRKSFFSVHDNTLSTAGFDIRSDEERKIPEWRNLLRMRTHDQLYPPEEKPEETPVPTLGIVDDESDEEDPFGLENVETAMSAGIKEPGTATKGKRRHKDKKSMNNEKEEYRPLYDYLKYR